MIFQDYTFANIYFLWALAIIPFLAAWLFWRPQKKQSVLRMSSLEGLESPTFWTRIYPLLWVLRLLAIALLIVALARPRTANVSSRTKTTKGIDIVMAIDISSSMLSRVSVHYPDTIGSKCKASSYWYVGTVYFNS